MAYPAQLLITRAFYTSRIVARGLQTVTGEQQADGLFLLNELLTFTAANSYLIPYYKQYDGVFIPGVELYNIPGLLAIESMTFNIQTVRYPMNKILRVNYHGDARINDIRSLPFSYSPERVQNGMNVYVYYLPDLAYTFQIWGKFGLSQVSEFTDLSLTYDNFYIDYLRYALASYICDYYSVSLSPGAEKRLKQIVHALKQVSPPDLTIQKLSTLNAKPSILNYGQANIGQGYEP